MPYTYILDGSIKSPTLILTAHHSTLLFLPGFFTKKKNFCFLLRVNLYMIRDTYFHDPYPFNSPFFMTPPFSAVSKSCDLPSVFTPPPPLLISDKSLSMRIKSSETLASFKNQQVREVDIENHPRTLTCKNSNLCNS